MTIDERLEALTAGTEALKISSQEQRISIQELNLGKELRANIEAQRADNDAEAIRIKDLRASIEAQHVSIESLHSNIHEMYETVQNNREEGERRARAVEEGTFELKTMMVGLSNIVIRHEDRLDAIDGGDE